jgi:O-antigen ligase
MEITRVTNLTETRGPAEFSGRVSAGIKGLRPTTWRESVLWGLALTAGAITFSIALGEALLGLTLVLGAIWVVRERPVLTRPLTTLSAGVFVVWALISVGLGAESTGWGKSPRLIWMLALPLTALAVRTKNDIYFLLKALTWGGGILALLVLIRNPLAVLRGPGDFMSRLIDQGSMTNGQMLMVCCVAAAGLWGVDRAAGRAGRGWLILLALLSAALVVNLKRGSWICAFLILAVFFSRRLGWKAPVILALLAGLILLIPAARRRLVELPHEFDAGRGGRMTMWCKIAPELIRRHPWGIGYAALTNRLMREVAPEVELNRNHLHSNPIQITVELGWLGLGIYLAWMLAALGEARRTLTMTGGDGGIWAAGLALIGLMANGLVEYNFGDTELLVVYAILMGLLSAGILTKPATGEKEVVV